MKRGDLLLGGIVVALGVFVAIQAWRAPARPASPAPAATPPRNSRGATAPVPASPAGVEARAGTSVSAGLLAPERVTAPDRAAAARRRAAARERLARLAAGTYMDEMLSAYDSTIVRWPERGGRPLRVWIQRAPPLAHWREDYERDARAAFHEWEAATTAMRFAFVTDSASSEVPLVWVDRFSQDERIGNTRIQGLDGEITGSTITVALRSRAGQELGPVLVAMTVRHEIGHLLGLTHTTNPTSIMQARVPPIPIGDADRATVGLLYSLPPGSIKTLPPP